MQLSPLGLSAATNYVPTASVTSRSRHGLPVLHAQGDSVANILAARDGHDLWDSGKAAQGNVVYI